MLISFLQYALDDVRVLSEQSARHLEHAITALAEDTSRIEGGQPVGSVRERT